MNSVLDPTVTDKSIRATEGLLIGANFATDLLLDRIVNSILVTREVVRTRKYRVARLSSRRIGPHATVRSGLGIARRDGSRRRDAVRGRRGLPVGFATVLLELAGSGKPLTATRISAGVCTGISPGIEWLLNDGAGGRVIGVSARGLRRRIALHVRSSGGGAVRVITQRIRVVALPPAGNGHAPDLLEARVLAGSGTARRVGRETEKVHLGNISFGGTIFQESILGGDSLGSTKLLLLLLLLRLSVANHGKLRLAPVPRGLLLLAYRRSVRLQTDKVHRSVVWRSCPERTVVSHVR
jgi:hypothetical protein